MSEIILGRNAVAEAIKGGRSVERLTVAKGAEGSVRKIEAEARKKGIPIRYEEKSRMDKAAEGKQHQGVMALVSDYSYCTVDDILRRAEEKNEPPFVLLLDGIEDPHNLGAIMRTAECAGVHGIIIPKRRAVQVNDTVAKTSAGAVEHILCARTSNIGNEIERLKKMGLWAGACDMDGDLCYSRDFTVPTALVIGGEGTGVGRLVKEKCDFVVSIPMKGSINSLNASNAASILMYEVVRQRMQVL